MAIFKKKEKTEEEIKKAEERGQKVKNIVFTGLKVVGGIVVFAVGAALTLAAIGMSADSSTSSSGTSSSDNLAGTDATFIDHDESTEPVTEETV